jgi:hypothetical protein
VDVLARPEKLKKFAQISTKRRRKAFFPACSQENPQDEYRAKIGEP